MTTVLLSRNTDKEPMRFSFDSDLEAFIFWSFAQTTYKEDDLVLDMEGEEDV